MLSMCVELQPESPLHKLQKQGQGWLLGTALLQRPQLLTLQQLLIKGLINQDSQLVTVQVWCLHPFHKRLLGGVLAIAFFSNLSLW